jgi:hypothetical protein
MIIHPTFKKAKKHKLPKAVREQYDAWLKSHTPENKVVMNTQKFVYKLSSGPRGESVRPPSLNTGLAVATKAPAKVYTGTKVMGIATMHKSNAVPVFNNEEAVAISSMRR